jgi:hypothetical protein
MMIGTSQQIDSQFGTYPLRWETTRSSFAYHLHLSLSPPPPRAAAHTQTCVKQGCEFGDLYFFFLFFSILATESLQTHFFFEFLSFNFAFWRHLAGYKKH